MQAEETNIALMWLIQFLLLYSGCPCWEFWLCLLQVKFCAAQGTVLGTSALFRSSALPALLLYRGGDLVGNLVRVSDQLGDDFYATDVEALLQEYGLLPEKLPNTHSSIHTGNTNDSDSDLEID